MKVDSQVHTRNRVRGKAWQWFLSILVGAVSLTAQAGTQFSTVLEFGPGSDSGPRNGMIRAADGRFYGVRQFPWAVFGVNTNGTGYTSLHTFPMNEGGFRGVMQASDGMLYGAGFDGAGGFLYRINTNGSGFEKTIEFTSALAGQEPTAPPVEAPDGFLYGILTSGTVLGHGGIYKVSKDGNTASTLFSLSGNGGANPGAFDGVFAASLIEEGGDLYGVTPLGGEHGFGVIFRITLTPTLTYIDLHHFQESEGALADDALLFGSDGRLYGAATDGGIGFGTVFRIEVDGSGFHVLHRFNDTDGNDPSGALIEGDDGRLYGLCFRGGGPGDNNGVAYRLRKNGTGHSVVHRFRTSVATGVQPEGALVKVGANSYYGTTTFGLNEGSIFRIVTTQSGPVLVGKRKRRVAASRKRTTIRGRAVDDLDVERVLYRIRGKPGFRRARGFGERWRVRLRLDNRRTVMRALAFDFDGNVSPARRYAVIRR